MNLITLAEIKRREEQETRTGQESNTNVEEESVAHGRGEILQNNRTPSQKSKKRNRPEESPSESEDQTKKKRTKVQTPGSGKVSHKKRSKKREEESVETDESVSRDSVEKRKKTHQEAQSNVNTEGGEEENQGRTSSQKSKKRTRSEEEEPSSEIVDQRHKKKTRIQTVEEDANMSEDDTSLLMEDLERIVYDDVDFTPIDSTPTTTTTTTTTTAPAEKTHSEDNHSVTREGSGSAVATALGSSNLNPATTILVPQRDSSTNHTLPTIGSSQPTLPTPNSIQAKTRNSVTPMGNTTKDEVEEEGEEEEEGEPKKSKKKHISKHKKTKEKKTITTKYTYSSYYVRVLLSSLTFLLQEYVLKQLQKQSGRTTDSVISAETIPETTSKVLLHPSSDHSRLVA